MLEAGLKLDVSYADIDEARLERESVSKYAIRVALAKAKKIADEYSLSPLWERVGERGCSLPVVIGVDTVIALVNKIYGKPRNRDEAKRFLRSLSGKWHKVYSGTVVIDTLRKKTLKELVVSKVKFVKLTDKEIDWYISTGEPMHAAGAYAIQGKGMALIESVNGCLTNIIGISIPVLMKMLEQLKVL